MKKSSHVQRLVAATLFGSLLSGSNPSVAAGQGWSVVPYLGISQLGDQSASLSEASAEDSVGIDVALDSGFTAGLAVRYDYADSPWQSEFGWEYRSNDAVITPANSAALPGGNYASNTFYLNGRYMFNARNPWTPWVGGGLHWVQEVDLDSETAGTERSFSDSGGIGFQVMAGVDYKLSERFYLTSELRYSSNTGIDLSEEGGSGSVLDIDYQPITLGLGVGYRF